MAVETTFDTILGSLNDLQHVKTVNEEKLTAEVSQRKDLELQVQRALEKLKSVSTVHSDLSQKEQTAEHVLTQLKKQIKCLEIINQEKNSRIDDLNRQLLSEDKAQDIDLADFERAMTELTIEFRTAPEKYSDTELDQSIGELAQEINELKSTVLTLEQQLSLAEQDAPMEVNEEGSVDEKQICLVLDMFTEELKSSEQEKIKLVEEEKQLMQQIDELDSEVVMLQTN